MTSHTARRTDVDGDRIEFTDGPGGICAAVITDPNGYAPNREELCVGPFSIGELRSALDELVPLDETRPGTITDEDDENLVAVVTARNLAELRLEKAEAFAARWKETARRLSGRARIYGDMLRVTEAWAKRASGERDEARESLREANETVKSLRNLTARDHLAAAWEAAHVPADGVIPEGSHYLIQRTDRNRYTPILGVEKADIHLPSSGLWGERRLIDPPAPTRPKGAEAIETAFREKWPDAHATDLRDMADTAAGLLARTDEDGAS